LRTFSDQGIGNSGRKAQSIGENPDELAVAEEKKKKKLRTKYGRDHCPRQAQQLNTLSKDRHNMRVLAMDAYRPISQMALRRKGGERT